MPNSRMGQGLRYGLTFVDNADRQIIVTVPDPQTIKDLKVGDRISVTQFGNSVKVTKGGGE
jgi:hypothetical protein